MLEADPNTDWSKVNVEALRQHLIDMDHVTMRSEVAQRVVPGGFRWTSPEPGARCSPFGAWPSRIRRCSNRSAVSRDREGNSGRRAHHGEREGHVRRGLVARIRGLGFAGLDDRRRSSRAPSPGAGARRCVTARTLIRECVDPAFAFAIEPDEAAEALGCSPPE